MNAQQLRNSILQEAIEGRLVPQDPNDEPASVLLERIREEKIRLVKEDKLKKKDLEEKPISEDEKPFDIPKGWVWVRWGELGEYKKGPFGSSLTKSMFVPKSDNAIKVYEQKNAIQKNYSLGDYYISKEKYETMTGFTVHSGDIIVSCAGTIGETYLLPSDAPVGIINQALMRARLYLESIIPYWLLNFQYILLIENKLKGSGSAIKNIPPFEVLKAMPVPLPPLEEQKRIVTKIEELLPKVDEYGKAQDALDKLNKELPERLKKSILQEAISGRLVPQDPNDEPASVLLDKIRKEKAQLVKEGKLKKKDLIETPITDDEKPFDIPNTWEWVRLSTLTKIIHYGYTASAAPQGNSKLLRITDIQNDKVNWTTVPFCTIKEKDLDAYKLNNRDILIARTGGTVGKTYIVRELSCVSVFASYLIRAVPLNSVYEEFVKLFMGSPFYWSQLTDATTGTGQPNVNGQSLSRLIIPLPPLAEQKRIVAKIEELFAEIDKLKA